MTGLMLMAGSVLYGIFLIFSGATLIEGLLMLGLFGELIVTWNAMSYLTAIKDYRGILLSFTAAIIITFAVGWLLLRLGVPHVIALLVAVSVGYGIMLLWDVVIVPIFSAGKLKRLFLPALGGCLSSAGVYRTVYESWTVRASCHHVDRSDPGAGEGAFLRSAVSRRPGAGRLSDDSCDDSQFCPYQLRSIFIRNTGITTACSTTEVRSVTLCRQAKRCCGCLAWS